jgi:hypothetical protein
MLIDDKDNGMGISCGDREQACMLLADDHCQWMQDSEVDGNHELTIELQRSSSDAVFAVGRLQTESRISSAAAACIGYIDVCLLGNQRGRDRRVAWATHDHGCIRTPNLSRARRTMEGVGAIHSR